VIEYKKEYKVEEDEVLGLLSENLKNELIVNLNGKVLQSNHAF
jgi:hypothetical protein